MGKFKSLLLEDYEYGDIDVPEKYDDLDFEPPSAAQDNAQQVIDWKEEHGRDEVAGMTQTGWQRANQLADGVEVSPDVIGRMASFARHEKNKEVADEYEDTPWKDKGHVAWLGWGGDEGVEWAQEMQDKMDKIDQQNEMKLTQDKLRSIINEELSKIMETGALDPRMPTGRGPREYVLYKVMEDFKDSSKREIMDMGQQVGRAFTAGATNTKEEKIQKAERATGKSNMNFVKNRGMNDLGGYFISKFDPGYAYVPVKN